MIPLRGVNAAVKRLFAARAYNFLVDLKRSITNYNQVYFEKQEAYYEMPMNCGRKKILKECPTNNNATEECQAVFQRLKKYLYNPPVLRHLKNINYNVDATGKVLGASVMQEEKGIEETCPIAYPSQTSYCPCILVVSPPWCDCFDESAPLVPRLGHREFQDNSLDGCESGKAKLLEVYQQLFNVLYAAI
ncbi:hypothetical protein EVAR_37864_1 [Eumeta japonica]|uniref:Uncharacterized protein n=1 Tax=Eumeta variegata TaxID=151549 RepID=A0A4C1X4L1_EUMVA|nr:hypothetical protein EVAR_37864_1 [Eumeta japonica]